MTIEGNAVLGDGANALDSEIICIYDGISDILYSKEQIDAAFISASAAVSSYSEMLDAISNIKTDETIVLMDDIAVDAPLNFINADTSDSPVKINLNLNGNMICCWKRIFWSGNDWSLISVGAGVDLTIDGNGSVKAIPNDSYAAERLWRR